MEQWLDIRKLEQRCLIVSYLFSLWNKLLASCLYYGVPVLTLTTRNWEIFNKGEQLVFYYW